MTDLSNVPIDKIETDIMSILYGNINKTFNQYTLFNKLLQDKYSGEYSSVHSEFKTKYLLILNYLASNYDDVYVSRMIGIDSVYTIVCKSNSDAKITPYAEFDFSKSSQLNGKDVSKMYDYIYENNLTEFMEKSTKWDGNTIFHELVLFDNITQVKKLLKLGQFKFFVKNNFMQTPIELASSTTMTHLLVEELEHKIALLNEQLVVQEHNNKLEHDTKEIELSYYKSPTYTKQIIQETSLTSFVKTKYPNKAILFVLLIVCFLFYTIKCLFNDGLSSVH